jgi:tetratricopeptide (TPR) repeat protein
MRTAILLPLGLLLVGPLARPARADLRPLTHVDLSTPAKVEAARLSTEAANALVRGDYPAALAAADKCVAADANDPWCGYDRAAALAGLQRVDDAVAAFEKAEARFGSDDPWGRSLALYGRAHALSASGRCDAAQKVYEEYALFVEKADAASASMARQYAAACNLPGAKPVARRHRGAEDTATH